MRHVPAPTAPGVRGLRVGRGGLGTCLGAGEVWASTVIHPPTLPAFASRTPYGAVVVRLEEGVFLVGNVVDRATGEVAIGMPVAVVITEVEDGVRLPLFRLVR
ncbi:MAG TPA: OB-fold domain-containing protein [Acidimicrobiia bacterium]|nr:OB-fold domain-containing protein [Acidimicrobiia bacterium]